MSKIRFTFAALMIALILPSVGQAQGQVDYFPLASGMAWAYGDSFHVVRVTGMMKSLPPIYITDYTGQQRNFIKQDDGKVLEWRDGKLRLLYDFGAKPGASWKIEPLGDGFEILDGTVVTVADTMETVKTPYGVFTKCVHLEMRPRPGLADAGFTDVWFAPGVGLVKWSEVWIGGVRSYALTRFSTGAIRGDFNHDGRVDFTDFFMFAAGFGKRSSEMTFERAYDLDGDGEVGFGDFLIFADDFGRVP